MRGRPSVFVIPSSLLFLSLAVVSPGCGKKGPPLAPLNLAPEAPKGLDARRLADTVYLRLIVPDKTASGQGRVSLDHLDVYAVTLAPGAPAPGNRFLLKPEFVVAKIPVRPPVDPDEAPAEDASVDGRAKPGDTITFLERLTPPVLTPQQVGPPPDAAKNATPPPATPGVPAATPDASAAAPVLSRLYVIQGVAKNGSKGPASARVTVPLLAAPAPPRPGTGTFTADAVTVQWDPPPSQSDEASGVTYNVYPYAAPATASATGDLALAAPVPLNDKPIAETAFTQAGAKPDQEQCFVVRSVATVGTATIESNASDPICVTPRDTFPPAAPKGLAAVSGAGVINLIWDPNSDADLGGYLVLRGEAPGDTLQTLTPTPIRETRYADRTTRAGVTYFYAVIAVDRAAPPNQSALSNKVQETAR
jgi:hypothetical protein